MGKVEEGQQEVKEVKEPLKAPKQPVKIDRRRNSGTKAKPFIFEQGLREVVAL